MIRSSIIKFIFTLFKLFLSIKKFQFHSQMINPMIYQKKIFKKILKKYSHTQYGKKHSIGSIQAINEFQQKIPIANYNLIAPYIRKDYEKFSHSILPNPAIKWEYTSGSTNSKKAIPYTSEAMKTFTNALYYWLSDLLKEFSFFKTGVIFYSISPNSLNENNGLVDDSEYLPPFFYQYFKKYLINPPKYKMISDSKEFRIAIGLYLLENKNLETIFIWSPSYLLSLINEIECNKEFVLNLIDSNKYKTKNILLHYNFSKKRADEISTHWKNYEKIWPHLRFISCWTEASAKLFIPKMTKLFPNVMIQGKGLIATESVYTIPINKAKGAVPLPNDHFYEFRDENNQIYLLNELSLNRPYYIIISNFSGLLRYEIGDQVRATHYYKSLPVLEFIGRGENESDLTGEKLTAALIDQCLINLGLNSFTSFLHPINCIPPYYQCVTDCRDPDLPNKLEVELCKIIHYKESRRLGQLTAIKVKTVDDAQQSFYDYYIERGIKFGDIKFSSLIKEFE